MSSSELLLDYLIFYYATKIRKRGKTRFDITTILKNPFTGKFLNRDLPIESLLLYSHNTPLHGPQPVALFEHRLKNIDFSEFNQAAQHADAEILTHKNRLCFTTSYSSSPVLKDNCIIQLPKPVLARDLFFSHPYLLRAAFFAERYLSDIVIDRHDSECIHIFIAQNKKIAKKDVSDPEFLHRLALILLNPALNKSFRSIYDCTFTKAGNQEDYDFDMLAPEISGIDLDVSGIFNPDSGIYRIERIKSFHHLDAQIDRPVKFHFTSQNIIKKINELYKKSAKSVKQSPDEKPQLSPEAEADIDQELAQFRSMPGQIFTKQQLAITLSSPVNDFKKINGARSEKSENENVPVAGGEGSELGTNPGFTMRSEHSENHLNNDDFLKMLEVFSKQGYTVKELHRSPFKKHKRFRCHLLKDKTPRRLFVYQICSKTEIFYLFEIDTSDGKKNISTLMLYPGEALQRLLKPDHFETFKSAIISQSLGWPKAFLADIIGITTSVTIHHPSKNEVEDPETFYSNWAQRILNKFRDELN